MCQDSIDIRKVTLSPTSNGDTYLTRRDGVRNDCERRRRVRTGCGNPRRGLHGPGLPTIARVRGSVGVAVRRENPMKAHKYKNIISKHEYTNINPTDKHVIVKLILIYIIISKNHM